MLLLADTEKLIAPCTRPLQRTPASGTPGSSDSLPASFYIYGLGFRTSRPCFRRSPKRKVPCSQINSVCQDEECPVVTVLCIVLLAFEDSVT
jgi:hypothetical protein